MLAYIAVTTYYSIISYIDIYVRAVYLLRFFEEIPEYVLFGTEEHLTELI